jgi:hypothetical protein
MTQFLSSPASSAPRLVRQARRYYELIRLPAAVRPGITASAFPRRPARRPRGRAATGPPGSRARRFRTCLVLRPRRASRRLATNVPHGTPRMTRGRCGFASPSAWNSSISSSVPVYPGAPKVESINELCETLKRANAPIEAGPIELTGARRNGTARGVSVYTRDPDQNLLEFIVYQSA